MRAGRIAIYGGGGAPYHHAAVLARAGHAIDFVYPVDILEGALAGFDALVVPGGGYRAMQGQIDPLGVAGARAIETYVREGGMYVGSCAGSYDAAVVAESFVRACPAQKEMQLLDARVWNENDTEWLGLQSPGVGVLRARTVAPEHPVMAGMPAEFEIAHYNGPLFEGAEPLAAVAHPTEHFTPAERFLGDGEGTRLIWRAAELGIANDGDGATQISRAAERGIANDEDGATLISRAAELGIANVVAGSRGSGRVVLFGSHPEFGFSVAMDDEPAAARMLANAVAWQLEESGAPDRPAVALATDRGRIDPEAPDEIGRLAGRVRALCEVLRDRRDAPGWLEPAFAMSVFGLAPRTIWERSIGAIERLVDEVAARAGDVDPRVLSFRPPVEWDLDGGYHGVIPLLEQAAALLEAAEASWSLDLGEPSPNPYAFVHTSPYHLVAGSYLAAVGRVAGAALLCRAYERRRA